MSKPVFISESLSMGQWLPQAETVLLPTKQDALFIGIPNEPSPHENRVALTPSSVASLVGQGHRICIETGAGLRAHFSDHSYSEAGAEIIYTTEQVYKADILLKVAPLTMPEIELLQPNQIVITPVHLPSLTKESIALLKQKRVVAIAIDYVKDASGAFPMVRSMAEIAGMSAVLTAAELLSNGTGQGILLGGITGVPSAKVVIIGAGMVAQCAARTALGLGAEVRIFDNNTCKLLRLQSHLGRQLYTSTLNPSVLERELLTADVAIGALHSHTGRTPIVVSDEMVSRMTAGSVIIDVSIDQGGVFATSQMTTLTDPTFLKYDIIHYCVPNIASRVAQTASNAVSNMLTPLLFRAADAGGFESLIGEDMGVRNGVYTYKGCLTNQYFGDRFGIKSTDLNLLLTNNL
jgi:alanine dehydrogenase